MKKSLKLLTALFLLGVFCQALGQDESETSGEDLSTVTYTVPPAFLTPSTSSSSAVPTDPFAEPSKPKPGTKGPGPKQILENAGVSFPEGATVIYDPANSSMVVRNTRDQHDLVESYLDSIVEDSEKQILVIHEMIEVDHLDFSDWLLANRMGHDGTDLRKAAQEWVREERGTILHTTSVMARSGQRAKVESVSEHIYPTEFSAVDMPTFHTQRITTQVSLLDGRYAFLGTTRPHEATDTERTNPLILNFVRADVGKVSGWKRVK